MAPPKRKNNYLESYSTEFPHTKKSKKGDEFAHCLVCNDEINLTATGKTAISLHQKTEKHKKAAKAANRSIPIREFATSTSTQTDQDRKILAAEGTWAYHTARHAISFKTTDCVSSDGLFRTIFPDSIIAKKFSCARTKTAKILTGVLAPYSVKKIRHNLGNQPFSISIDASNHGNVKLFPLIVRYFTKEKGIEVRLLDLESIPGETSEQILQWINKIFDRHKLNFTNLSSFCADNTYTNFGGPEQRGQNNVFFGLRQQKKSLIGIGCPAHILHNAARSATNQMRINGRAYDIEAIIFKLTGHFKTSTKRIENLKSLCEGLDVDFTALNNHGPTRWTTMETILGKIIKLEEVLLPYFGQEENCSAMLYDFFVESSDTSFAVLHFLHHVMGIFNKSIDALQREKAILPQLLVEMQKFREKIEQRKMQQFFGAQTNLALQKVEENARKEIEKEFLKFYDCVLSYLEVWFRSERFPEKLDWIALNSPEISHADVLKLAEQIAPEFNNLFDEVSEANQILKGIPNEQFQKWTADAKWMKLFEADLPELY